MIHDMQTHSDGRDPAVKWLRRAAWLMLIVMTVADVAVTFGHSFGLQSNGF
jgi:hypothetical protein